MSHDSFGSRATLDIDGRQVEPGDAVIGIASNGIHSNGYSLVHAALEKLGRVPEYGLSTALVKWLDRQGLHLVNEPGQLPVGRFEFGWRRLGYEPDFSAPEVGNEEARETAFRPLASGLKQVQQVFDAKYTS